MNTTSQKIDIILQSECLLHLDCTHERQHIEPVCAEYNRIHATILDQFQDRHFVKYVKTNEESQSTQRGVSVSDRIGMGTAFLFAQEKILA